MFHGSFAFLFVNSSILFYSAHQQVSEFIVVVGGWSDQESGHAVMYIVQKDAEDSYSFVICNGYARQ
jgi:hypothetical protein